MEHGWSPRLCDVLGITAFWNDHPTCWRPDWKAAQSHTDSWQNWAPANTITSLPHQKSLLYILFTMNRQTEEGNKLIFSSFMIQRKLWCFLGNSEKSFIIIKTKTGALILLWKSNKKHTTRLSCQESAMESAARSTASGLDTDPSLLTLH